jgi:hypothetical protein
MDNDHPRLVMTRGKSHAAGVMDMRRNVGGIVVLRHNH